MIKLFQSVIFQFSLLTFMSIMTLSLLLGSILSRNTTDYLIRSHINSYPTTINLIVSKDARIAAFLIDPQGIEDSKYVEELFFEILSFADIFRIKVWGADGTVLWSDRPDIIGKNFKNDENFQNALKGQVEYEISEPHEAENMSEKDKESILEIYVPVIKDGRAIGVLEVYVADRELYERIYKGLRSIWILVAAFGSILYCFQFFFFYRAHRLQQRTTAELAESQNAIIYALAYQAELRDLETGRHLDRTAAYVRVLAEELSNNKEYKRYLTDNYINDLVKSAPLHDIGKSGIPDAILRKPGRLTDEEFLEMTKHCQLGAQILQKTEVKLSFRSFLTLAIQLTISHHEKWNGKGYPLGLKGNDIPVSGRIMALADVYDALRSKRVYKDAFSHEKCVQIIKEERGEHFDPLVVDAFLSKEERFRKISEDLQD